MVVGFNHNFRYQGEVFHVQTEDGGLKNPQIITLLYRGGTILASRKTSYSDISKVNNLSQVVEELMKEQHREMLRGLKDGDFDDRIAAVAGASNPAAVETATAATSPLADKRPDPPVPQPSPASAPPSYSETKPAASAEGKPQAPTTRKDEAEPAAGYSLDDIILSYLIGEDRKS